MSSVTLYGPDYSTYTRSLRIALAEKGVDYDLVPVDIFEGEHKTPEHLARHPFGKVPAFQHEGVVLFEVQSILRYIDEAFPGPALQPSDLIARTRSDIALQIIDSYAYPTQVTQIVIQRLVVPLQGGTPDEEAIAEAIPLARMASQQLEQFLTIPEAGAALDLSSIHYAPIWDYLDATDEGHRLAGEFPHLAAWWAVVKDRPSVASTKPNLG